MVEITEPVYQKDDGKWYHCDETWSVEYGPFDTKDEADKELDKYCKECLP